MNTKHAYGHTPMAQAVQLTGLTPAATQQGAWNGPVLGKKQPKQGKLVKNFLDSMDYCFTLLLLLSGEEEYETMPIGHIL